MKIHWMMQMARDFASLPPRPGQILNTLKYSYFFFRDRFPHRLPYNPLSIGVYITYSCNLACPFCWNPTINNKAFRDRAITPEELEGFLRHPRLRQAFRVSFVGGEPLIHPDIFRFIEICRREKKLTMFPTNGLLIEKHLEAFRNTPLTALQISLYDDHIEEQLANARALLRVNPRIQVSLARYVTNEPSSLAYMEEVVGMAERLGIRQICFQNFQPQDEKHAHLTIYDDDLQTLAYLRAFEERHGRRFHLMLPAPLTRDTRQRFCYDLYTVVFLGKGGVLAPCSSIVPPGENFGTLAHDDFWNNEYLIQHRRHYNDGFPFHPTCTYCYEGGKHERIFI